MQFTLLVIFHCGCAYNCAQVSHVKMAVHASTMLIIVHVHVFLVLQVRIVPEVSLFLICSFQYLVNANDDILYTIKDKRFFHTMMDYL